MRPPAWNEVLSESDAAVLHVYARERPAFAGESPVLLVIDVTEAFVGPDTPVEEAQRVSRQACGSRAWGALPQIATLIERFRAARLPVMFTVPDPNQAWVGAATRGSAIRTGAPSPLAEVIRPEDGEAVVEKAKASAFFGTPLVSGLVKNRHDTVVLVGGTTSGCIRASAVDATSYGFEVIVPSDAVFDRIEPAHQMALIDIDVKYGRVHTTEETLGLLALG